MVEVRKEFMGKARTDYMIGTEVEKTPAYLKKTLFVQGFKSADEIKNRCFNKNIYHVYLGANRSFDPTYNWDSLILSLLNDGFYVTLDYLMVYHKILMSKLSKDVWQHKNFIPMITVDITNLCGLNDNLTVKIDDTEFASKGVWCLNQKQLADPTGFTGWDEYADDESIE